MRCRGDNTVFEIVKTLLDIPALFITQVDLFCRKIKVAAEGKVSHPDLFKDILGGSFFLAIVFVNLFNIMSDKFCLAGIIPKCVDEISFVAACFFPEPYCTFVEGKYTVPFIVVRVLIESSFDIHGVILQRENIFHPCIQESGHVFL